jgi:signal transduction histidine kinase
LIPIIVLLWLGLKILRQESDVERQRAREDLELAAGRLALTIDRRFAEVELRLQRGEELHLTQKGIEGRTDLPLLYQPQSPVAPDISDLFAGAEAEELKKQNLPAAATAYEQLAGSDNAAVSAAALVRLARVLRKRGDLENALHVYGKLEELGAIPIDRDLSSLIGREGRAKIFQETGQTERLRREADDLARLLYAGNLPIDRATFDFYSDLIHGWTEARPPADLIACTDAAISLWQSWRSGELRQAGRRVLREQGIPVLAIWIQERLWLASSDNLQQLINELAGMQRVRVSVSDIEGNAIFGTAAAGSISVPLGESHLPFIIHAAAIDTRPGPARIVLLSGLTVALILMAAAAATLYRVTTRELLLAQQQSDFVSAVSHEFRTPLTSMRHLTELLVSRTVTNEERKAQYYELLAHETERLHRMVETLLSFGRIDAGAYAFRLQPTDIGEFVSGIVEEFRAESDARGHEIRYDTEGTLRSAAVDRDALARALWNLLENAVKYSESGKPIHVFVRQRNDAVLLGVEDQGIGIPASEREKIFQKFVRGAEAKQSGIRGVGIGLALVKHIAEAHGGSVSVESEVGRGSTFIVVIPCPEF